MELVGIIIGLVCIIAIFAAYKWADGNVGGDD